MNDKYLACGFISTEVATESGRGGEHPHNHIADTLTLTHNHLCKNLTYKIYLFLRLNWKWVYGCFCSVCYASLILKRFMAVQKIIYVIIISLSILLLRSCFSSIVSQSERSPVCYACYGSSKEQLCYDGDGMSEKESSTYCWMFALLVLTHPQNNFH